MFVWHSTRYIIGAVGRKCYDPSDAGQHYGSDTASKYNAIWNVYQYGQSYCGGRHSSSLGSINADAVYSEYDITLAAGRSPDFDRKLPCSYR